MDIVTYILCKSSDKKIMEYVKAMERLTMVVQDTVPTVETAEPNKLYLVDTNHDGTYEEYVLAEISGEQQIIPLGNITDLDNYFTKPETMTMINTLVKEVSQKNDGDIKVVKYNNTETTITVDQSPVDGSLHLISSDAVYDAVSSVHTSLTTAEYEALTPAQKSNGSEYFVYDANTGYGEIYRNDIRYGTGTLDAINIIYDNTTSSLTATNVQDALDEVVDNIDGLFSVLTKVQYDALTPAQKADGTIYFVVLDSDTGEIYKDDKLFGATTAVHVSYDNTSTGLVATNIQDAVDELAGALSVAHVSITQAAYDTLTPAEKANGTVYFVTPASGSGYKVYYDGILYSNMTPPANTVTYDHTTSGLAATDVQAAIDEVAADLASSMVQLTTAQYEALTPAQQANGTAYFVYDTGAESGVIYRNGHLFSITEIDADNVNYDNTTSGLTSTNIQDAVDEIVDDIEAVHIDLTQAQYNALPAAEKTNGTEYFITDAEAEGDFSNLETRLHKMESNFIDVSPNVTTINPAAYKRMTRVSDNEVQIIINDPVAHKDYLVTVTASGSGNTRYDPQYIITEVV